MGVRDLSMIGMQLPEGMSHAQFNNNPGNIKCAHPNGKPTDYAEYLKSIGVPFEVGTKAKDGGYFFHFPDAKTGYEAAQRFWLETKDWMVWDYGGMTLDQALRKYSGGGYDIEKLQQGAEGRIDDIDGSTNIMEITDEQWARIMNEQTRWEDVNYYNKIKEENISVNINGRIYDYQRADGTTATTDAGNTVDQDIPDLGKTEKTDKTEKKKKLGTVTQEMIDYMGDSGADLGIKRLQDGEPATYDLSDEERTILGNFTIDGSVGEGEAAVKDQNGNIVAKIKGNQLIGVDGNNEVPLGTYVDNGDGTYSFKKGPLYSVAMLRATDEQKKIIETFQKTAENNPNFAKTIINASQGTDTLSGEDLVTAASTLPAAEGQPVTDPEDAIEVKKEYETLEDFYGDFVGPDGRAVYLGDEEDAQNAVKPGDAVRIGGKLFGVTSGGLVLIQENGDFPQDKEKQQTISFSEIANGTANLDDIDVSKQNEILETRTITTSEPRQQMMTKDLELNGYYTIAKGATSRGDNVIGGQSGVVQLVKIEDAKGFGNKYTFVNQRTGESFQVSDMDLLGSNALLVPTQYELDNKETFEFGENERIVVTNTETGDEYVLGEDPDGTKDTTTDEDLDKTDVKVETTDDGTGEGDDGKGEGIQTAIENAGAIGQSLLQTAGAVLDGIGGPGAIISYVMGKQGLDAAMKEVEPMQKAELSPMFMQHLRQSRELSKRGFHPDQEREFQNELDKAYQVGLENAVRGTGGDRAKFLAQSGVLDAQRSAALIDYAAKDAELQNANLEKYENMMLFKENFDIQRTEEQRAEDLERQIKDKEAAAGFVGSAFSSLMNSYASMNTNAIMQNMGQGLTNLFNPITNMQTGQNPFAFLNQNKENN
mgnify:CR=1 FL=1